MENLFRPGSFVRVAANKHSNAHDWAVYSQEYNYLGYPDSCIITTPVSSARLVAEKSALTPVDINVLSGAEYRDAVSKILPMAWWGGLYYGGQSGTDPEIFAFDAHGEVIPAWKWLKTKSENPGFYWDGVQAELTTEPKSCHEYLTEGVTNKLRVIDVALKTYDPKAYLRAQDVVELDPKTLLLESEEHIMLGCSPSLNAYSEIHPIEIPNSREHKFRYSGCHRHFSDASPADVPLPDWWPNGTVAMMDKIGGILLTALGRDVENPIRRKAYGRPGEYRLPAGPRVRRIEYRTPGAFLLQHPAIFHFGADMCRMGFRLGQIFDGRRDDLLPNKGYKEIITDCDADGALAYIKANKAVFDRVIEFNSGSRYTPDTIKSTWKALKAGIKQFGIYDKSLAQNWDLPLMATGNDRKWRLFCAAHIK